MTGGRAFGKFFSKLLFLLFIFGVMGSSDEGAGEWGGFIVEKNVGGKRGEFHNVIKGLGK